MPDDPLKVILMGTGPFAVPSFDAIHKSDDNVALVVTRPEIVGKSRKPLPPSPVRAWADTSNLPIYAPDSINEPRAVERIADEAADLLVVCDYGQILSPAALENGRLGGINLHGSLLPKYRGAAPVQWSVWSGDTVSGVSVIHMTPRLDGGPIIARAETPIGEKETAGELEERLSQIGVAATLDAIALLRSWDGSSIMGEPQDKSLVSKAPRLSKHDGRIDWAKTRREIDCHIRAMQPWPAAFTEADTGAKQPIRLVIGSLSPSPVPVPTDSTPGQIIVDGGVLAVVAGDGCVQIDRIKPAGKRDMPTADYLRGNPFPSGLVLK